MSSTTLAERRKRLLKQLDALKIFSNTSTVRKLRQELNAKLGKLETKIQQGKQVNLPMSRSDIQQAANAARAAYMRKEHNYIRQIVNTFPDISYAEARHQLKERRQGKHTKIPDVIWRNPSP